MLKISSPLSDEVEYLVHQTIGCCIRVHRTLGPGLFERIYSRAVCQVVLEIKSVEQFAPIHHKQVLNYMRIAGLRAGLLINFNVAIVPDGMSRKIL